MTGMDFLKAHAPSEAQARALTRILVRTVEAPTTVGEFHRLDFLRVIEQVEAEATLEERVVLGDIRKTARMLFYVVGLILATMPEDAPLSEAVSLVMRLFGHAMPSSEPSSTPVH